jgi:hypothetical protein
MTIFGHVKENMKSRVKGDFHARFCGKAGVKFPCLTRLCAILMELQYGRKAIRRKTGILEQQVG